VAWRDRLHRRLLPDAVTVGLAALQYDDGADALLKRADADLYRQR
jgi:hypothetical protein